MFGCFPMDCKLHEGGGTTARHGGSSSCEQARGAFDKEFLPLRYPPFWGCPTVSLSLETLGEVRACFVLGEYANHAQCV